MHIRPKSLAHTWNVLLVPVLMPTMVHAVGAVSGVVEYAAVSNGPIAQMWVDAYDTGAVLQGSGFTGSNGLYVVTNLASGDYYLRTTEGWWSNRWYVDEWFSNVVVTGWGIPEEAEPVAVADGQTNVANFVLEPGGAITGSVWYAAVAPLSNVWVDTYTLDGDLASSSTTDTTGNYSIVGIAEGLFYVRTFSYGLNYADEWYNDIPVRGSEMPPGVTAVAVISGPSSAAAANFQLEAGATIAGRLASGGSPVSNVWADVYGTDDTWLDSGLSDVAGDYEVTGLPAGTYYVRTYGGGQGYADEWYDDVAALGWDRPGGATAITLGAGGERTNVNFSLAIGGVISGTVTNPAGAPIADVRVDIYGSDEEWLSSAVTDGNGDYEVVGLHAGTNFVRTDVGDTNYVDEWWSDVAAVGTDIPSNALPIAVTAGSTNDPIDFGLADGGVIGGMVQDTNYAPLPNVFVDVYDESSNWVKSATTSTGGTYRVVGLPGGTYNARSDVGAMDYADEWYDDVPVLGWGTPAGVFDIPVVAGVEVTNVLFVLGPGGSISGRVTDAAMAPLPAVAITVHDPVAGTVAEDLTGYDGAYFLSGLPGGQFNVRTGAGETNLVDEWYDDVPVVGAAIPPGADEVAVSAGVVVASIDFVLSAGGVIAGTVTGTGGVPVADVAVDIYDGTTNWIDSFVTGGDGTYEAMGLAEGTVFLRTYVADLGYADEWFDDTPVIVEGLPASSIPIAVYSNSYTNGIDFALVVAGNVEGSVTDRAGYPLHDIAVDLYDAAGTWFASQDADDYGVYQITGLSPGTYYARTYSGSFGFDDEWYSDVVPYSEGGGVPDGADALVVTPGSTISNVDFGLDFLIIDQGHGSNYQWLVWQGAEGAIYTVARSPDMGTWTNSPDGTNIIQAAVRTNATQGFLRYEDIDIGSTHMFYRVEMRWTNGFP